MASFLKVGKARINLDLVQTVDERNLPDPTGKPGTVPGVLIRFSASAGDTLILTGDDAKAFLAAVDTGVVPAVVPKAATPAK